MTVLSQASLGQVMSGGVAAPGVNTASVLLICLVLVILAAVAWWWGRAANLPGRSNIRLLGTRMLGGRRCLTLIEVEGERLLLALAGDSVNLLKSFGKPSNACNEGQGGERMVPPRLESAGGLLWRRGRRSGAARKELPPRGAGAA